MRIDYLINKMAHELSLAQLEFDYKTIKNSQK